MKDHEGFKSRLKSLVADTVFHGPISRLGRWVWDNRSLESIADRVVNPTKSAIAASSLALDAAKLSPVDLAKAIQDAAAQAHRDISMTDDFQYLPTRDGRIFFTTGEAAAMKIEAGSIHDIEVSRHWDSDHAVTEDMRSRVRRDFEAPSRLLLDDIALLEKAQAKRNPDDAALYHPDFLASVNHIGEADMHVPLNMITQVGRAMYNTQSKGFIQNSKPVRYLYATPEMIPTTPENTDFVLKGFRALGLTQAKVDTILSDPEGYVVSWVDGKVTMRNLNYANIVRDLTTKRMTNRCLTVDGNSMVMTTMLAMYGRTIVQDAMGRTIDSLINIKHPDYIHPRKGIYKGMIINGKRRDGFGSFEQLRGVSADAFDNDGGSGYFVRGVYGAKAKRLSLTMLKTSELIPPSDVEDSQDVSELAQLKAMLDDKDNQLPTIPDWATDLYDGWLTMKGRNDSDLAKQDFGLDIMKEYEKTLYANQPLLRWSDSICDSIYTKCVGKDGTGVPPSVRYTEEYGFSLRNVVRDPKLRRRLEISVGKSLYTMGVRGEVARYVFKDHGSHFRPLAEHGAEVVWNNLWSDIFVEMITAMGIIDAYGPTVMRPLFDGGMINASLALPAAQAATKAINVLPVTAKSLMEQYGYPHPGKTGDIMDPNGFIVSIE